MLIKFKEKKDINIFKISTNLNSISLSIRIKSLFPFDRRDTSSIISNNIYDMLKKYKHKDLKLKKKIYTKQTLLTDTLLGLFTKNWKISDNFKRREEFTQIKNKDDLIFFFFKKVDILRLSSNFLKTRRKNKKTFIRATYKGKNAQIHICKKYYYLELKFIFLIKDIKGISIDLNNKDMFDYLLNIFKFYQSNHLTQWSRSTELILFYRF